MDNRTKYIRYFGVLCLLMLVLAILYFLFVKQCFPHSAEERGQFGDSFGALTAFLSGLSFAGVIVTIWMQADELRETRKEMQLQRLAQENQADATRKQNELHEVASHISILTSSLAYNSKHNRKSKIVENLRNYLVDQVITSSKYDEFLCPSVRSHVSWSQDKKKIIISLLENGEGRTEVLSYSKTSSGLDYDDINLFDVTPHDTQYIRVFSTSRLSSDGSFMVQLTLYDSALRRVSYQNMVVVQQGEKLTVDNQKARLVETGHKRY